MTVAPGPVARILVVQSGFLGDVVLTTPLLLSWDGTKMSSSAGNNIPLTAPPEEQFGRTMRIPDSLLGDWSRLVAEQDVPPGEPPVLARTHFEQWGERYLDSDPDSRRRDPPAVV